MKDVTRAAAAIISDPEGRVLLVQHSSGQRRWGLPGGRIRPAEFPVESIVREVRRETGMEIEIVDLLGLYHLYGHLAGDDEELPDLLTYAFRCRTVSGEPVLNGQGRICQLGWYSHGCEPAALTPTARATLDDCAEARSGVVRDLSRELVR